MRLIILTIKIKTGVNLARPSRLNPEIKQKIGENIALGLTYSLAAEAAGITYRWLKSHLQPTQDLIIHIEELGYQTFSQAFLTVI